MHILSLCLAGVVSLATQDVSESGKEHSIGASHAPATSCDSLLQQQVDVRTQSDLVYRVVGKDSLRLDLVKPVSGPPRPLVVVVHGGGWRAGDKSERLAPVIRRLAAANFAVASVDYRLTQNGTNLFPAALEDVSCAVAFLRARSAALGVDARRLALIGESAGGQLAALAELAPQLAPKGCATASDADAIVAVVGMYGIYDFLNLENQPRASDAVRGYIGGEPSENSAIARRASPVTHASSRSAPALFIHGSADRSVFPDQSRRMRDALSAAGVEATFIEVSGQDHGFPFISDDAALRESSCALLAFLNRHLGGTAPAGAADVGAKEHEALEVRIIGRDFRFEMPARLSAGRNRLTLVNLGAEPHYAGVMRLDSGKTVSDFAEWRNARAARPAWLTSVGGVAPIQPGDSAAVELNLPAGRYVVFCSYPSPDGVSHLAKGMFKEIVVESRQGNRGGTALPDSVSLRDFSFTVTAPIVSGTQTLRVVNRGSRLHQLLVVQLPDSVTAEQEMAWFERGSRGTRPGLPSGGVLQLPPGESVLATLHLKPGRYLLLCSVREPDGRSHHSLGMRTLLDVRVRE